MYYAEQEFIRLGDEGKGTIITNRAWNFHVQCTVLSKEAGFGGEPSKKTIE